MNSALFIEKLRSARLLILILVCLTGFGCASTTQGLKLVTPAEKERILSGGSLSPAIRRDLQLPDEDIFGLDKDMQQFADKAVGHNSEEINRVYALLDALISPDKLGLKFDTRETYTATGTFAKRQANCLSFTILVVSMLKYLGIHAEYNEVDIPPVWDLQNNDTFILNQHVNAIVITPEGRRKVLDINMKEYSQYYLQRKLDEKRIEALFYNNRGIEYLLAGDTRQAFRYTRKAIELAPELPIVWTNLGTLYRSQGKFRDAEVAIRIALELNPDNLVAISSAERNYRDLHEMQLAQQFRQRAEAFREKNPYYRYTLARNEVIAGDYTAALKDINAAIKLNKQEHRFFFLQGVIYTALQEQNAADISFKKALQLASDPKQRDKYRHKMDLLI